MIDINNRALGQLLVNDLESRMVLKCLCGCVFVDNRWIAECLCEIFIPYKMFTTAAHIYTTCIDILSRLALL